MAAGGPIRRKRKSSLTVGADRLTFEAPGLKIMSRPQGRAAYWIAARDAVARGYRPKTVRLHYNLGDGQEILLMAASCRDLQTQMQAWLDDAGVECKKGPTFDGTIASVIDIYKEHEASPYHELKPNSRESYNGFLKVVERTVGKRRLDRVKAIDFRRWHKEWKKPERDGGPERLRRAYGAIQMLRIILAFGAVLELRDCVRLEKGLALLEFPSPKARDKTMTFDQAKSFVDIAIEAGAIRLALGHACQFELMLRQADVIGQWEKLETPRAVERGHIVRGKSLWKGELCFEAIGADGVLQLKSSKTGSRHAFDLKAYPLVQRCIDLIPLSERKGPLVVRDDGFPFDRWDYARRWREIATKAKIPADVWNRDNRASGVTEARNAGAAMDDISKHAGHSNPQTTRDIYDRSNLKVTRRVQTTRVKARKSTSTES